MSGTGRRGLLAIRAKKPVFLLGGFGGATKAIIRAIRGEKPDSLSPEHQCRDDDYAEMIKLYEAENTTKNLGLKPIDCESAVRTFNEKGIKGLNNGLTDDENNTLFAAQNREPALTIVLRGLSRLWKP